MVDDYETLVLTCVVDDVDDDISDEDKYYDSAINFFDTDNDYGDEDDDGDVYTVYFDSVENVLENVHKERKR